jgi:hypothetical protein
MVAHTVVRHGGSYFLDSLLTDGGEVSLTRWPRFTTRTLLVVISVRGWLNPRAIMQPKGLGKVKESGVLAANRTRDLLLVYIEQLPVTALAARHHQLQVYTVH